MENGLCRIPEEVADSARSRIIGILSNASPPSSNLSTGERRAIKLLQDDDDILILPVDKGRATVVMDRQDYEQKILLLLEDSHTYKKLAKDPAQCLQRKMNVMLLELKRKGSISEQLYSHLRCSAGRTPPLYGLPKIHKRDVPLRPIASFVHFPSYQLSKRLAQTLAPLVGNSESHVTNLSQFVSFIQMQKLVQEDILVSFDEVSLFTCVPVELAVDVVQCSFSCDEHLPDCTSLCVQEIVRLLSFCLSATYLSFCGEHYQQILGSPVSVTVANLVMEDVEDRALVTTDVPVRFWRRYVDDTCTASPASCCQ